MREVASGTKPGASKLIQDYSSSSFTVSFQFSTFELCFSRFLSAVPIQCHLSAEASQFHRREHSRFRAVQRVDGCHKKLQNVRMSLGQRLQSPHRASYRSCRLGRLFSPEIFCQLYKFDLKERKLYFVSPFYNLSLHF